MKTQYRKHNIVMVLCFLVGGFSIIMFMFQMYSSVWSMEFRNEPRFENNFTDVNRTFERPPGFREIPVSMFTSPFSFMFLLSGITLLMGGISIWMLTKEKDISHEKEKITSLLLMPEERIIIDELKKSKGNMIQSQLVKKTGMSKVKIHRIVNRLAAKGIVKKYQYGLTNKIVLEKEV